MMMKECLQSPRSLVRIVRLLLLVFISCVTPTFSIERQQQQSASSSSSSFLRKLQGSDVDFSCNVAADSCGLKFNGQCDNTNADENCVDGDCFDCDQCRQFDYDCNSCIRQTGCLWCPGDALCYNSHRYLSSAASCQGLEDYTDDSCSAPDEENFFE
jgi:hypothetical protein